MDETRTLIDVFGSLAANAAMGLAIGTFAVVVGLLRKGGLGK